MAGEASRWVGYDEAADLLGLPAEAAKRLALRRRWPGPAGATLVAVLEGIPGEPADDPDEVEVDRGGARSLLDDLELHVERLTEELTETRTEMRGVGYEAESLRIEAGRVQLFAALVEAERARSAEIRAERDRLADELARCRRSWIGRVLGPLLDRRPARTSPSSRDPSEVSCSASTSRCDDAGALSSSRTGRGVRRRTHQAAPTVGSSASRVV